SCRIGCVRAVASARSGERRQSCVLHGRRAGAGTDRVSARQALRPGPGSRQGLRCPAAGEGSGPMLHETVVTTISPAGTVHVAPMGIESIDQTIVLKPFKPSVTL